MANGENWKIGGATVVGWATTFEPSMASPVIANRIYKTLADAEAYVNNVDGSACQGLILSVLTDSNDGRTGDARVGGNKGIYQIRYAKDRTPENPGAREGRYELVKVDSGASQLTAGNGINITGDNQVSVVLANTKSGLTDNDSKSGLKFVKGTVNDGEAKTGGQIQVALRDTTPVASATDKSEGTHESGLSLTKKGLGVELADNEKNEQGVSTQHQSGLQTNEKGLSVKVGGTGDGKQSGLQTTTKGLEIQLNDVDQSDGVSTSFESGLEKTATGLGVKVGGTTESHSGLTNTKKGLEVRLNDKTVDDGTSKSHESGLEKNATGLGIKFDDLTTGHESGLTTTDHGLKIELAGETIEDGTHKHTTHESGLETTENGLKVALNNNASGLKTTADGLQVVIDPNEGLQVVDAGVGVKLKNANPNQTTEKFISGLQTTADGLEVVTDKKRSTTINDSGVGVDVDNITIIHEPKSNSTDTTLKVKVAADRNDLEHATGEPQAGDPISKSGKNIIAIDTADATKGIYATAYIKQVKPDSGDSNTERSYQLFTQQKGEDGIYKETALGDKININKDKTLGSTALVSQAPTLGGVVKSIVSPTEPQVGTNYPIYGGSGNTDGWVAETANKTYLRFEYLLADGSHEWVYLDVSQLLTDKEFGDGLILDNTGTVYIDLYGLDVDANTSMSGLEFVGDNGGEGTKDNRHLRVNIDENVKAKHQVTNPAGTEAGKKNSIDLTKEGLATAAEIIPLTLNKAQSELFNITNPIGNLERGKQLDTIDSIFQVLKLMLTKTYPCAVTNAQFDIVKSNDQIVEVGTQTADVKAHYTFTDGNYKYTEEWIGSGYGENETKKYDVNAGQTVTTEVSGDKDVTTLDKDTDKVILKSFTMTDKTYTTNLKVVVTEGTNTTATPGAIASMNSSGVQSNSPVYAKGGTKEATVTIKPGFKWFWGYAAYDGSHKKPSKVYPGNTGSSIDVDAACMNTAALKVIPTSSYEIGDSFDGYKAAFKSSLDETKRTFVVIVPKNYTIIQSKDSQGNINTSNWEQKEGFERNGTTYDIFCSYLTKTATAATIYQEVLVGPVQGPQA